MEISQLKRGLIVSCQATREEPMHGPQFMARMALASEIGGAVGVRVNGVDDICAAKELIKIPVIGIIKRDYPGTPVRITPTLREIREVAETGAEIVAVDCSFRKRPDDSTSPQLIAAAKREFPEMLFMADIATVEEGKFAWENGADIVASTLAGYPKPEDHFEGMIEFIPPSLEIIGELAQVVKCPIIAEGRMATAENAVKALALGAHCAVIGWSITRPQIIARNMVNTINQYLDGVQEK